MSINRTPKTWGTEELTSTDLNAEVKALWAGLQAAWTAYTPSWTASGTNPSIGNGTIAGSYLQVGKTILVRLNITAGSSTTYGTGNYAVSLPVAANATGRQIIQGDVAIGSTYRVRGRIEAGASVAQLWTPGTSAGGADRTVTPTAPTTFVSGAVLVLQGVYEAA